MKVKKENKLQQLYCKMAFPELKEKVYQKPEIDIYDEQRNEVNADRFLRLNEIKVEKKKKEIMEM